MKENSKNRMIRRIIIYVVILASTFYAVWIVSNFFNLFFVSLDNARYLLSAMAQSKAAVIAIIITMSLVAVQLTASAYSPRVIDIFKRNPDLWFLLALYGGSILYDFFILSILTGPSDRLIFVSYWLCASAFLSLFPYIHNMMTILNPQAIIKRLLEDISPQERFKGGSPFQPIAEIVHNAFLKNDYETIRMGLRGMTAKVVGGNYSIVNEHIGDIHKWVYSSSIPDKSIYKPSRELSEYYCENLKQIGKLFAERNEELTLEAIANLDLAAEIITENSLGKEGSIVGTLESIGEISVQSGFQKATERLLHTIGDIGESISYGDYKKYLPKGGKDDFFYKNIAGRVIKALDTISILVARKWGLYGMQTACIELERVGISIAKEGLVNKLRVPTIANIFLSVGLIVLNQEENPTFVEDSILYERVISPLAKIGKIAYKKKMLPAKKGHLCGFGMVVYAIWHVGTYAARKEFNSSANKSAKALAQLTLLDKGIVKDELGKLKFKWEDQHKIKIESLKKFQEFMRAYEKHLKELKASKKKRSK